MAVLSKASLSRIERPPRYQLVLTLAASVLGTAVPALVGAGPKATLIGTLITGMLTAVLTGGVPTRAKAIMAVLLCLVAVTLTFIGFTLIEFIRGKSVVSDRQYTFPVPSIISDQPELVMPQESPSASYAAPPLSPVPDPPPARLPAPNQGQASNQNQASNQEQISSQGQVSRQEQSSNQGQTANEGQVSDQGQTPNQEQSFNPEQNSNQGQTSNQEQSRSQEQGSNQGQTSNQASSTLDMPTQVSPADGTRFDHYPRTTTLKWLFVPGAAKYFVEIECWHCVGTPQWSFLNNVTTDETTYTFDFVGKQPGRWRVAAIAADGTHGPSSGWWQFEYMR